MINTKAKKFFFGLVFIFAVNNLTMHLEDFGARSDIKSIIETGAKELETLNLPMGLSDSRRRSIGLISVVTGGVFLLSSDPSLLAASGLIGGVISGVCLLSSDIGKKVCNGENITLQEKRMLVPVGVITLATLTAGFVGLYRLVGRCSK